MAKKEKRVGINKRHKKEIEIKARTEGQENYINLIESKEIVICNGKAGTGKTLLAVGMALKLLKSRPDKYKRIIMTRPAVTVKGEDLGFLPGDLEQKMHPFMMPMLDGLKFYLDVSDMLALMELGIVEISPISHMRGRTFNNCIMIFDEAQNSTASQMKMVVTRIGFSTKMIIEGDMSQSDLEGDAGINNGLKDAIKRFSKIDGVGVCLLGARDIVRSPILSKLIEAYD